MKAWETLLLDEMDQGILMVNEQEEIPYINRKGQEIIGMWHHHVVHHPEGHIEPGDFVCMVDFPLGDDDGGLNLSDLQHLGIRDTSIQRGDYLLAMGCYGMMGETATYLHKRSTDPHEIVELQGEWKGMTLVLTLDRKRRHMEVRVNDKQYGVNYLTSYGHMVVLDGETGALKFVQAHGYTIRREALADLLRGGSFHAKGPKRTQVFQGPVAMETLMAPGELTQTLRQVLQGRPNPTPHSLYEINKRLILGTVKRLETSEGIYAGLTFSEIVDLATMLKHRPPVLEQLANTGETETSPPMVTSLVAISEKRQKALHMAGKVAVLDYPMVLQGEPGTGKNRLARELHSLSRPKQSMIKIDLHAMKPSTMSYALFGHQGLKRQGALELAAKGTLYLRGIEALPGHLQGALFQELTKVGQPQPRLIVGSTVDLATLVEKGEILHELQEWLSTFVILLPSLRECPEDLLPLAEQMLAEACAENGMALKYFSDEAKSALLQYHWPGNMGELERVILRAIHLAEGEYIGPKALQLPQGPRPLSLKKRLAQREKEILRQEYKRYQGNKHLMLKALAISKTTLYDKLKAYGIDE